MTADDKRRIVAALNRRYCTTVPIELIEMAVASELTTWERLAAEVDAMTPERFPYLDGVGLQRCNACLQLWAECTCDRRAPEWQPRLPFVAARPHPPSRIDR